MVVQKDNYLFAMVGVKIASRYYKFKRQKSAFFLLIKMQRINQLMLFLILIKT